MYAQINTVFLDVGNTLVSMDYERLADEFREQGVECDASKLARAEAAARPIVSAHVHRVSAHTNRGPSTEEADTFEFYLSQVLLRLAPVASPVRPLKEVARSLVARLRQPGASHLLWNTVMRGVPEALADLQALGLRLAVVSNSDGTVEQSLRDLGLHSFLEVVLDSAVVGHEKPDPRIFEQALAACDADPARTLHFGDLYHVDVLGARRAGIHAALIDPYDDWNDSHSPGEDYDCDRFLDLLGLSKQIREARQNGEPRRARMT